MGAGKTEAEPLRAHVMSATGEKTRISGTCGPQLHYHGLDEIYEATKTPLSKAPTWLPVAAAGSALCARGAVQRSGYSFGYRFRGRSAIAAAAEGLSSICGSPLQKWPVEQESASRV